MMLQTNIKDRLLQTSTRCSILNSNNAKDAHSLSYSFLKLVQGSFHQGNHRFGEIAGRQCVCNSLMSFIRSSIKKVSYWKSQDLDNTKWGQCV